jgi:hypothetical protein
MDPITKTVLIISGGIAICSGAEIVLGAIPNRFLPYKSKILNRIGKTKGFLGKLSRYLNEIT